MKIIKELSEMIEEEIEGAKDYSKNALLYKEEYPTLANVFYTLANTELEHVNVLHEQVVMLINRYRSENGEPPEKMKAVYDYLHEKHIDNVNEVKNYQTQYKG